MNLKNKIYCDWDLIRFVKEEQLMVNGVLNTISLTCCNDKYELMIFFGKDDSGKIYEVRIYKTVPSQVYLIHDYDKVTYYGESADIVSFGFESYSDAIEFLETIQYRHPEFNTRPMRKISETME